MKTDTKLGISSIFSTICFKFDPGCEMNNLLNVSKWFLKAATEGVNIVMVAIRLADLNEKEEKPFENKETTGYFAPYLNFKLLINFCYVCVKIALILNPQAPVLLSMVWGGGGGGWGQQDKELVFVGVQC